MAAVIVPCVEIEGRLGPRLRDVEAELGRREVVLVLRSVVIRGELRLMRNEEIVYYGVHFLRAPRYAT